MKRRCPWEVDHQPMLKVHHSEKDQMVSSGSGMESVYAKTLAMLFSGANQRSGRSENNNQQIGIGLPPKFVPTAVSCVSCVRSSQCALIKKCVSCSGFVCDDCHQICVACQQIVCGNCSIVNRMCGSVCLGCRD